jgi:hypothetical protein
MGGAGFAARTVPTMQRNGEGSLNSFCPVPRRDFSSAWEWLPLSPLLFPPLFELLLSLPLFSLSVVVQATAKHNNNAIKMFLIKVIFIFSSAFIKVNLSIFSIKYINNAIHIIFFLFKKKYV